MNQEFLQRIDTVSAVVTVPAFKKILAEIKDRCQNSGVVTDEDSQVLLEIINFELKLVRYKSEDFESTIEPFVNYIYSIAKVAKSN